MRCDEISYENPFCMVDMGGHVSQKFLSKILFEQSEKLGLAISISLQKCCTQQMPRFDLCVIHQGK